MADDQPTKADGSKGSGSASDQDTPQGRPPENRPPDPTPQPDVSNLSNNANNIDVQFLQETVKKIESKMEEIVRKGMETLTAAQGKGKAAGFGTKIVDEADEFSDNPYCWLVLVYLL